MASKALALVLALLPCPLAWALSSDRDQPIHIESDKAMLQEKQGISVYTGNVHLRQGTLNMRGDRMTVTLKDNRIDNIVLVGNPATYVQKQDNRDAERHAEIEYYSENERLVLIDEARIWEPGAEDFRSERIVINLEQDTVDAGGGKQDRVRITLPPRKKTDGNTQ
jgi:lipopolysaccharide export system protein LptA